MTYRPVSTSNLDVLADRRGRSSQLVASRRLSDRTHSIAAQLNRSVAFVLESALRIGLDEIERRIPRSRENGNVVPDREAALRELIDDDIDDKPRGRGEENEP